MGHTHTHTDKQRHTETHTDTHRHTDTQTHTHTMGPENLYQNLSTSPPAYDRSFVLFAAGGCDDWLSAAPAVRAERSLNILSDKTERRPNGLKSLLGQISACTSSA